MATQQYSKQNILDNYVTVAERIAAFYHAFPLGRICTSIIEHDRESGFVLVRAEVYRSPDDASPAATGHAYEYKDTGYVQRTNYIEVAETSAVGRGLAFLNFETKRGIAPREEAERPPARTKGDDTAESRPAEARAVVPAASAAPVAPATEATARASQPATEEQKQEMLALLESLRPKDRRAQRRLLTELTGKQSRDDLTQQEAQRFIKELKKGNL